MIREGWVLRRLREVLDDPRSGAAELAEVIAMDPELKGQVLRVANAAYYRRRERVDDLTRAVVLVGFAGIAHALRLAQHAAF